jgi:hypothetical protein
MALVMINNLDYYQTVSRIEIDVSDVGRVTVQVFKQDTSIPLTVFKALVGDNKELIITDNRIPPPPEEHAEAFIKDTLDKRIEALEAALKPFADLADHISNEGAMMEVCRPCPENPARTILPILTKHFTRASVILREGK